MAARSEGWAASLHGHVPSSGGSRACARLIVRWRRGPGRRLVHERAALRSSMVRRLPGWTRRLASSSRQPAMSSACRRPSRSAACTIRQAPALPSGSTRHPRVARRAGHHLVEWSATRETRREGATRGLLPRDVAAPVSASCQASYTCATPGMPVLDHGFGERERGARYRLPPGGCTPEGGRTSRRAGRRTRRSRCRPPWSYRSRTPSSACSPGCRSHGRCSCRSSHDEGSNVVSFVNQLHPRPGGRRRAACVREGVVILPPDGGASAASQARRLGRCWLELCVPRGSPDSERSGLMAGKSAGAASAWASMGGRVGRLVVVVGIAWGMRCSLGSRTWPTTKHRTVRSGLCGDAEDTATIAQRCGRCKRPERATSWPCWAAQNTRVKAADKRLTGADYVSYHVDTHNIVCSYHMAVSEEESEHRRPRRG